MQRTAVPLQGRFTNDLKRIVGFASRRHRGRWQFVRWGQHQYATGIHQRFGSALAAWSQGVSFDVRALPRTCTAALGSAVVTRACPTRREHRRY